MFHHSLVSFYIALQYCLSVSVCECACVCMCVVRTYSRPYGRRQITAWTSPTSLSLQILGLNAEAKKKKKKKQKRRKNMPYTNEEGISSNSAILYVLYWCTLKYTLSRLLMKMILPKQYL